MRVAIIGGGIAGLSAAFYLRRLCPAAEVEMFEAAERLGGAIQTQSIDGYLVEHGADMFATQPGAALELCHDLGIENELLKPLPNARGAAIVRRGKLIRIPEGFVLMRPTRLWPMMCTPLLSMRGKLRLLAEPWIRQRGSDVIDESIESFVTRRLGRETLDRIVQPLVGGIYTGDVAKLSMAATMFPIWEMERQDGSLYQATRRRNRIDADATERTSAGARYENFRSFAGGMGRLIDALAATLDPSRTHLATQVTQVTSNEDGWHLQTDSTQQADSLLGHRPFQHIVLATPARIATRLLASQVPEASRVLHEINSASSAVVVLGIRDADIPPTMPIAGLIVPIQEGRNILAVSFTGDKFAGRTPPGRRLIRVFIGGDLQKSLLDRSDAQLLTLAIDELRQLIGLRGEPELSLVIRWNDAMPQYHVGHLQRMHTLQRSLEAHPGLSLIGNSLQGVGIAHTVAGARTWAHSIARQCSGDTALTPTAS